MFATTNIVYNLIDYFLLMMNKSNVSSQNISNTPPGSPQQQQGIPLASSFPIIDSKTPKARRRAALKEKVCVNQFFLSIYYFHSNL